MKIAVTVTVCHQIGIETWKDFHTTKVFDGDAKVAEIDAWIKSIDPTSGLDSSKISSVVD